MTRQKYSKKGTVMIEVLLMLMFITIVELLVLPAYREAKLNSYNFRNEYLLNQTLALKDSERKGMDTGKYGIGKIISLNHSANVNQAKTLYIDYKKLVITLGTGKIHD